MDSPTSQATSADSDRRLTSALSLAERGFRIFPLSRRGWKPAHKGWQAEATTDLLQIFEWWSEADFNIGVATGQGLVVIDVDDKSGKNGSKTLDAFKLNGETYDTFTVRTPTGGRHIYFAGDGVRNSAGRLGKDLDVRGAGGYVVGPGSFIPDGAKNAKGGEYVIERPAFGVRPLPEQFLTQLQAPPAPLTREPVVKWDLPASLTAARAYLTGRAPVAVEKSGGDHTTYAVAARIRDFGVSEDAAFDLLAELWNDRCAPPWDLEDLRVKVANAYAYAKNRPGVESPAHAFAGVADDSTPVARAPTLRPRLHFLGDDAESETTWLIKGLLPSTGVALLFGQSRVGKSFLLHQLAAALGTATPWFDRRVRERVAVLLVAGEGGSTVPQRLEAIRRARFNERSPADISIAWVVVDDDTGLEGIIAQAAESLRDRFGLRLGMVAFDTIAAIFNVAEENDPHAATTVMKRLDRWSRQFDCLMLGVTHAGKDASRGVRGSSGWTASADVILGATADIDEESGKVSRRKLALTKSRVAETGPISGFELERVVLGIDADGDPISSAIVRSCEVARAASTPTSYSPGALDSFRIVCESDGRDLASGRGARLDSVRDLFAEKNPDARSGGNLRRTFKRAVDGAGLQRTIVDGSDWLILPGGFTHDDTNFQPAPSSTRPPSRRSDEVDVS